MSLVLSRGKYKPSYSKGPVNRHQSYPSVQRERLVSSKPILSRNVNMHNIDI